MENRIKEQQLELFADRTSTQTFESNQLRLWLSSIAYVLLLAFRQHCLADNSERSWKLSKSWNPQKVEMKMLLSVMSVNLFHALFDA